MQTIFSQAYDRKFSHLLGSTLTAVAGTAGNLLQGACFGDAACQQNRELLSQATLTNAQAQLAATQVAAINEQNEANSNQTLIYVACGFMAVVLILGSLFLLKKQ